jgi:MFS transporter, SP family, arabinose:H+ symporter
MENTASKWFVYRITLVAAIGGLLFGYDTAVIAGAIGFLQVRFQLSPLMVGWVASCALLGCILGAMFAGKLSDKAGRKKILILSAILFAVSSIGIIFFDTLTAFVLFRIIGGLGIGIASMVAPMYIAEIAPAEIRGKLVSINQLGIVSGILLIYFVNACIAGWYDQAWNVTMGWHWMFGSGLLPSGVFLVMLLFVPESPRWLAEQSRDGQLLLVLTKINGAKRAVTEQHSILKSIQSEQSESIFELFKPGLRKALLIGVVLAILSQVTGINAIMYYAPEIFKSTGDGSSSALLQTVLIGVVNLLLTVVAIRYVDRLGRKTLLLAGAAGTAVCLAIIGIQFYFNLLHGWLILAAILAYIAFFAVSLGPVTFVIIAEIFPNRVRGVAMSICVFFLWAAVYLVSQTFPVLLKSIGNAYTFWIYMVMSILTFLFVWQVVPETKGKTLEEMEELWTNTITD